jgi:protein-disulfide isomerase
MTAFFKVFLLSVGLLAAPADAQAPGPQYREFVTGNPGATVTVIEYASLTCPACAMFHNLTFPLLKKNYIDTGKIKFIYRDFPLDGLAMAGAMMVRCAPGDSPWNLIALMYQNQSTWITAEKPIVPLQDFAEVAGLSEKDFQACLNNQVMQQTVRGVQDTARSLYQVQVTPTLYVDDEMVVGDPGYEGLAALIDRKLAQK